MKVSRRSGRIIYLIHKEKMSSGCDGSGVGEQPLGNGLHDLLVDLVDGEVAAVLVQVEETFDGYGWSPAWASIAKNWRCVR